MNNIDNIHKNKIKEKRKHMLEEKIGKLLLQQSMPAIIGMLVMSLYNFVDTIFIGKGIGTDGIAAVSIVFPIQMIIGAFAMALGIGAASIISRKIGNKDYNYVSKTFGTFQTTNISISIFFTILGLIFIKPLLLFFGATGVVLPYAIQYFSVLLFGMVFFTFNMGNNNIIRSIGHPKMAMIVMLISAISNIILDAIFILYLHMGMEGAALATVISWIIGSTIVLGYFLSSHNIINSVLSDFKVRRKYIIEILSIGISSLARQVAASAIVIFINKLLGVYGGTIAIASYGIINRILMVFMMPMFGVVQGIQPILGFNHGAGMLQRVKQTTLLAIKILTIFVTLARILLLIYPGLFLNIFSNDLELIKLSVHSIRIIILLFPLIGFQIIASGFYQALGEAKSAFWFAIMRQVLILLPILIILPKIFGFDGILYSFPIADGIAAIIIFFIFKRDLLKIK